MIPSRGRLHRRWWGIQSDLDRPPVAEPKFAALLSGALGLQPKIVSGGGEPALARTVAPTAVSFLDAPELLADRRCALVCHCPGGCLAVVLADSLFVRHREGTAVSEHAPPGHFADVLTAAAPGRGCFVVGSEFGRVLRAPHSCSSHPPSQPVPLEPVCRLPASVGPVLCLAVLAGPRALCLAGTLAGGVFLVDLGAEPPARSRPVGGVGFPFAAVSGLAVHPPAAGGRGQPLLLVAAAGRRAVAWFRLAPEEAGAPCLLGSWAAGGADWPVVAWHPDSPQGLLAAAVGRRPGAPARVVLLGLRFGRLVEIASVRCPAAGSAAVGLAWLSGGARLVVVFRRRRRARTGHLFFLFRYRPSGSQRLVCAGTGDVCRNPGFCGQPTGCTAFGRGLAVSFENEVVAVAQLGGAGKPAAALPPFGQLLTLR